MAALVQPFHMYAMNIEYKIDAITPWIQFQLKQQLSDKEDTMTYI
jgi:hypothetical protein